MLKMVHDNPLIFVKCESAFASQTQSPNAKHLDIKEAKFQVERSFLNSFKFLCDKQKALLKI